MTEDDQRPSGWRLLDEESRQNYRKAGFSEDQIDEFEKTNVYRPVDTAIQALFLGAAVLEVLTERLGTRFAADVRAELRRQRERLDAGDAEDQVEGRILADFDEWPMWNRLEGAEPHAPTPTAEGQ